MENILLAVAGHLAIGAMLLTGLLFIPNPIQRIVVPDRIQIIEIDLTTVQITREETQLRNVAPPVVPAAPVPVPVSVPVSVPPPTQIQTPSVVPEPIAASEPTPTPAQTQVIRVNRETAALNRTMTVSVVDALRVAMTRCWVFNQHLPDIENARVVAHLTMNRNGMVRDLWIEDERRANSDAVFAYVVDTVRHAISVCQPFRMLPVEEFDAWERIRFTFHPGDGTVQ